MKFYVILFSYILFFTIDVLSYCGKLLGKMEYLYSCGESKIVQLNNYKLFRSETSIRCVYEDQDGKKFESKACVAIQGEAKMIAKFNDVDMFTPGLCLCGNANIENNLSLVIGSVWQKGDCDEASLKYYLLVKDVVQKKLLFENKFILLKEDSKSYLFYANPGLVVKAKKSKLCFTQSESCDLKLIYKKQLKNSIYDKDGKLHTSEDL